MTTHYRKCQHLDLSNYKIISFYFRFSEKAINCETISQKNFVPLSKPNEQNRDRIHCVFSNKLNHTLQSFLWWLLFSTTDAVSKLKCFIHHPLSTVKISSSVISSGTSSACPVGLTLRSAANYLPLFCTGAKVGKKKKTITNADQTTLIE